jgi:quercetin dioxygenase-like cupin family protein
MGAVDPAARPFVVPAGAGRDTPLATLGCVHKVPGSVTGGQLAIVEHTLAPRKLAAPLHRHSREDELSIVLEGEMGALLGAGVTVAGPGSYVWKPRGQWHTFWNEGTEGLRFVELLMPAGFEGYFEKLSRLLAAPGEPDVAARTRLSAEYAIEFDVDAIGRICERFGLSFG